MEHSSDYVKWFRNSAPYINAHRNRVFVLVLSGEAIESDRFATIVHDIALLHSLGVRLVIAYGARPQIERRAARAGVNSQFHKHRRITDEALLDCVVDAAGALRARIESLFSMGLANSPMHGSQITVSSGNFVVAKPLGILDGVDHAHTGEVRRVDCAAIRHCLDQEQVILLPPLGYSSTGEIFNLSAEDIAAATAASLGADKIIVLMSHEGLLDSEGKLLRQCEPEHAKRLLETLDQDSDAAAALRLSISACNNGVARAHLLSYEQDGALLQELFTRDGSGTLVTAQHYEKLQTASIDDIGGILEIIEPLESEGTLVKRSRERLENEITQFQLIKRDGMVIACAALYPDPNGDMGEIACVATHPDYRGGDRGERLLQALESQAKQQGLQKVFVLTTRTAHWFREQGFVEVSPEQLTAERQQMYNWQRRSKVFIKDLNG